MKKVHTRRSFLSVLLLTMVLSMALMIPSYAAAKRKMISSIESYDADGKLTNKTTYSFDSKGGVKKASYKGYDNGKLVGSSETTYKRTYYSGSNKLKKVVAKGKDYSYTTTYKSNGLPEKQIYKSKDFSQTTTYKSSGNHLTSAVTKNSKGKIVSKSTYNKHGNETSYTYYLEDGSTDKTTYKYKYEKGIVRKEVMTSSDGSTTTFEYNKKGGLIKSTHKDATGKTSTTTYELKYKGDYLTEEKAYDGKTLLSRTVYKYTSKKY